MFGEFGVEQEILNYLTNEIVKNVINKADNLSLSA